MPLAVQYLFPIQITHVSEKSSTAFNKNSSVEMSTYT